MHPDLGLDFLQLVVGVLNTIQVRTIVSELNQRWHLEHEFVPLLALLSLSRSRIGKGLTFLGQGERCEDSWERNRQRVWVSTHRSIEAAMELLLCANEAIDMISEWVSAFILFVSERVHACE